MEADGAEVLHPLLLKLAEGKGPEDRQFCSRTTAIGCGVHSVARVCRRRVCRSFLPTGSEGRKRP